MKQTCLCKYLGVTCNHPDTFLQIPASIRRRIYLYAGLITDTFLPYPHIDPVEGDKDCTKPAEERITTCNLINTCQQIGDEVEAIVLNQNTCVYKCGEYDDTVDDGLECLSQISPNACSMLRDVYVHLYVRPDSYYGREGSDSLQWERIEMWQAAAMNILASASPQQLRLHLICDTENRTKAAAVLQPLLDFPGVLLELEIRLHQKFVTQARETVLQVQARDPTPSKPFRFFDLPEELRRHIFTYTDLVVPYRKVHWDPESGFRAQFIFCECDGSVCLDEDLHAGRKFLHCGAVSKITGDFCMRYYGSYSSRCKHGSSPLSLLLTSRAMYNEAIDFFYASNRVVILPDWNTERAIFAKADAKQPDAADQADIPMIDETDQVEFPWAEYKTHDATKLFMERVGPTALGLIRNLEIVFPAIGPNSSLSDADTAYSEWRKAVDYLSHLATEGVPKLTLIVHIWTEPATTYPSWTLERKAHILEAQGHQLLEVLQPLSRLQLKRLFVHVEWPAHWSPPKLLHDIETSKIPKKESPGCGIGLHWIPRSNEDFAKKEILLEKMVMGDKYDSYSVGKGDELPSQWVRQPWMC